MFEFVFASIGAVVVGLRAYLVATQSLERRRYMNRRRLYEKAAR